MVHYEKKKKTHMLFPCNIFQVLIHTTGKMWTYFSTGALTKTTLVNCLNYQGLLTTHCHKSRCQLHTMQTHLQQLKL